MPINGLNVGKDVSIVVNTSAGIQRFSLVTGFNADPVTEDLKSKGLDGITRHGIIHDGWEGEIDYDRAGSSFDEFWAQLEEDFHSGLEQLAGTITETIIEPGGATSVWRYDNVVFKQKNTGTKKGNELVKGKLGFFATRRIQVA